MSEGQGLSKIKVGMVVLSDTGLFREKNSVVLNDLISLKKIIESNQSMECSIFFRDEIEAALRFDALFIFFGGLINFGGKQTENAAAVINLANKFNGPVIFFGNDVLGKYDNRERDNFVRFERPVYFANPSGGSTLGIETKDLDVAGVIELNQSFMIGKGLAQQENIPTKPRYDVVYGTRARPALLKRLQYLADHSKMLTFGNINKKIKNTVKLNSKMIFSNSEMRVINSFGKCTLMLYETHKEYFTSRVFEQLASNSLCLFDKNWKVYQMFWNEGNTFDGSMDDCLRLIHAPYSEEKVRQQHKALRSFDFDSYIDQECKNVESILM